MDKHLPIIFHHLTNDYTMTVISCLKRSVRKINIWCVNVIPKTLESYSSISIAKFRFIDSCQHLSHRLDALVNNPTANGTS